MRLVGMEDHHLMPEVRLLTWECTACKALEVEVVSPLSKDA
jgi:hypothetical protein